MCKPPTILYNKVTIKDARQAVQMFGPAQHAVAMAVADSVAEGVQAATDKHEAHSQTTTASASVTPLRLAICS